MTDHTATGLATRLSQVEARIARACASSGRTRSEITLLAASKTVSEDRIGQALAAGQRVFGESRAQELRNKHRAHPEAEWHFIGHLQRNKVRLVVGRVHLVHTIHSLELAQEIDQRVRRMAERDENPGPVPVLLEVNLAGEASKGGVLPDRALPLARSLQAVPGVSVRGLMCIPPFTEDPEAAAPWFRQLADLAAEGRAEGLPLHGLSMGMSHDFEVAIHCGATIVRVGTALFGPR